jgi:cytochrome c-type biogenesis protein CcmH
MALWISLALMCLVAAVFIALPLYRDRKRLAPNTTLIVVVVLMAAAGLYAYQGNPGIPSGRGDSGHSMEELIVSLEKRLAAQPDDLNGWVMLGRSNLNMRRYSAAVTAFQRAVDLENGTNAQTIVSLAEATMARDQSGVGGEAAALVETALALDPNNPQALFYGGIAAANNGDTDLAAIRWGQLQGLNPPPEIQQILDDKIAEWRGEPVAQTSPQGGMPAQQAAAPTDAIVTANVALADAAAAAIDGDATVFVIARDPAQPSPPIAVTRLRLSELPKAVQLGDQNSMVAGRSLSGFPEFELLVRVSLSGQPVARPGDWFASVIVNPSERDVVDVSVDQQVQQQ